MKRWSKVPQEKIGQGKFVCETYNFQNFLKSKILHIIFVYNRAFYYFYIYLDNF